MSDSAVKRDTETLSGDAAIAAKARRRRVETAPSGVSGDSADTEKKLARAARSAQRLAQLSDAQRSGETLDLFAEDAERANLQAQNTDIRQGTFEGFELPDVFLAAVPSRSVVAGSAVSKRDAPTAVADSAAPVQTSLIQDEPVASAASVETTAADASAADASAADAAPLHRPRADAVPELDRARATAFADTIDALRAVIVEQRASTLAHARRMKTMLTIIVCAMLVVVATGIAQTTVLLRMRHDSSLQQDRVQQLMLNEQATLSSLFDTDSENVPMSGAFGAQHTPAADASPIQPVSTAHAAAAATGRHRQAHRHAGSSAH
ncbi:cell wall surface anchor family protein [Candidatus Burkholderia verschuerenii]|uniref:Cell wall surface anchor family protein n=1 Tax=Candidatus Burkholderia verschuerenii TaxID=242163 RepID=A0A0L0MCN1_9BURK|nr:hypothetical protein [Candidatus Burkholderia verschuerenii]KND60073.1 cell wall surface anchor family protein [Candidatus Burkholderia verschuerenii]